MNPSRFGYLKALGVCFVTVFAGMLLGAASEKPLPNVILCMTDDQGWGDVGYNGHPSLRTPHLDTMSREGVRFDRFYSGAPVCSPTRGSALTGRHPYRYGIFFANVGHMKPEEITLAEALKTRGYATGHFGKWHLGTLTKTEKDSNRGGPRGGAHYAPPWENGFDECFSTEAKVPTWDPMKTPRGEKKASGSPYGTYYWSGPGQKETDNLEGDDSRVIMDRAIPFIEKAVARKKPFFAVIWFHTPHLPVVAGPTYRRLYANQPETTQHYYGCITAMDEQVGRLRSMLRKLRVADSTMLWFCSDNGPEGRAGKAPGTAGPLRGRKRSLYEGGVRVPGLLVWPGRIKSPRRIAVPCSTCDYFPTVLAALGLTMKEQPSPVDGVDLLPLLEGRVSERPRPLGFQSAGQLALIGNRYKIYRNRRGKTFELYDLVADPGEQKNLSGTKPAVAAAMARTLEEWQASCKASSEGKDYR